MWDHHLQKLITEKTKTGMKISKELKQLKAL